MSDAPVASAPRTPAEFEAGLERYLYESAEDARAVRVGEKEVSEQAGIVARYVDLFTREQLEALRTAEEAKDGQERERLYRLRKTCEAGLIKLELAEREDELENAILAARVGFRGERIPLRAAHARLAVLPAYGDREELGGIFQAASARFNDDRLELLRSREELEAELSGERHPVARSEEEKQISLGQLRQVLERTSQQVANRWDQLREHWFEALLGETRELRPSASHAPYLRRLSPLHEVYPEERTVDVCLATLAQIGLDLAADPNIRLDLEDRPQKSPRACVIASDPPDVVHLILRAQGGLHDYQAFLHEAGHALHYAGCDRSLPYTFRKLSRDHALSEIYSYICEAITREPGWHAEYFALSDEKATEHAEATTFLELLLFRRYVAKLGFELEFWGRFASDAGPAGYKERLDSATGLSYRSDAYLADMDSGFYSADYLRAWIRSAQLRARLIEDVGPGWWHDTRTGDLLRELFLEGTRPSSDEIAERLGFDPLDTGPLLEELDRP